MLFMERGDALIQFTLSPSGGTSTLVGMEESVWVFFELRGSSRRRAEYQIAKSNFKFQI